MQNEILRTIRYFSFFSYPPTAEEIHTFLKKKAQKGQISSILEKMLKEGVITIKNPRRYTLGEYSISSSVIQKQKLSQEKIKRIMPYVNFLAKFPQIQLIGLSGSVAMLNADRNHDVDLFIITAKNRLWTGRFIALLLAQFMNLRRKRNVSHFTLYASISDKVCLNLFFDESEMKVPKFKQTEYVAHEVLQMSPLVDKNGIYERFLRQNEWVYKIFPNAQNVILSEAKDLDSSSRELETQNDILNLVGNMLEFLLKKLQLSIIKLHQTTEIITDSQLWFHPNDFEKKIASRRA